jgi:uncharacterized protein YjbJ (UPF0337 family)
MTWDEIAGRWKQFRGRVKERWGRLTDNDLEIIAGQRDQLVGTLQREYGYARSHAEAEVEAFCRNCR